MRQIKEKLRGRRGASLLYALLLLLLASMVSVSILTAATTAVRRLNDDRDEEQEYLSLSSAAQLVAKDIENSSVVITETRTTVNGEPQPGLHTVDYAGKGNLGGVFLDCFAPLCSNYVQLHFDPSKEYVGEIFNDNGHVVNYAGETRSGQFAVRPSDEAFAPADVDFKMSVTKEGDLSTYPIDVVLQTPGRMERVYITAYISSVGHETKIISRQEDEIEDIGTIITEVVEYKTTPKWTATLSTNPPKEVTP